MSSVSSSLLASKTSFDQLDLDARLLRAVSKLGFKHPTLVQHTAIPLALKGKDIVARARTGSGKTAAYCLPIINKILARHQLQDGVNGGGGVGDDNVNGTERERQRGRGGGVGFGGRRLLTARSPPYPSSYSYSLPFPPLAFVCI